MEEALYNFTGCALITSHDRYFLDRVSTHILAFEGSSHVEWFQGNYESYEQDRKEELEKMLIHRKGLNTNLYLDDKLILIIFCFQVYN